MLIILDRDGVINYDSMEYIKSPKEWQAIPESLQAIANLNQAGHQLALATNQSGLGRGYFSKQTLESIHAKMQNELANVGGHIDGIYYCPHTPEDACDCRKPKSGLLKQIAQDFKADLSQACLIGDSLSDMQAAQQVGAWSILVRTGKGEKMLNKYKAQVQRQVQHNISNMAVYTNLNAAANAIMIGTHRSHQSR